MNQIPVQKRMDKLIKQLKDEGRKPSLLLHVCCAPCSSYVLEYLNEIFDVTVFYYNPNIYPEIEYSHRVDECKRLISDMGLSTRVKYVEGPYNPERYFEAVKGLESEPEGGKRCEVCFQMRLNKSCEYAATNGFDYVTTTLTISPLKNAELLNEIGAVEAAKYGIEYLPSDFKKKGGYQRSIELSKIYNLYRQNYCGCVFSKRTKDL